MWKEIHYQKNGQWREIWEEEIYECNICLDAKCESELVTPTAGQKMQLGHWQVWMKSCNECLRNIISIGPEGPIDETNIFFN